MLVATHQFTLHLAEKTMNPSPPHFLRPRTSATVRIFPDRQEQIRLGKIIAACGSKDKGGPQGQGN